MAAGSKHCESQINVAGPLISCLTFGVQSKVRISELADDLIREYRINGRKSIDELEARWELHLKPFFGVLRAVEVTSQLVAHYIDARRQEGAENATINRELAALKRMFNLARQSTPPKVNTVPYVAMLREGQHSDRFPRVQAA